MNFPNPSIPVIERFRERISIRSNRIRGTRRPDWKFWPRDSHILDYSDPFVQLEKPSHPEIEDQVLVDWGIRQSEATKQEGKVPAATVDVLYGQDTNLKWGERVRDGELEEIVLNAPQDANKMPGRYIQAFFINTSHVRRSWLPGNFSIRPTTLSSLRKAGLSSMLLSSIYSSEGFWAKMGNHCFLQHDENGNLNSFEILYRYLCGWDAGVGLTQFVRTRHVRTYFCINYPPCACDRLKTYIQQYPELAYREFFIDALAADDGLKQWQINIGERREVLLHHERNSRDEEIDWATATIELHRLSRDWHTLQQDCLDLYAQLTFLQTSFEKYMKHCQDPMNGWEVEGNSSTGESFEVLKSQCDNYARWTVVYRDRTNVRINLLFHLANQRESRTNTQIASATAKVAEQTQRDSASMITIAAVTMFFLPGTFVSAILSTTFFDYGKDGLSVSKQWWILPVVTLPLMIVVFGVWLGWQRKRVGKRQEELSSKMA